MCGQITMLDIVCILILLFNTSFCENDTSNAASRNYYFRMSKRNNELRVNNRIYYLNHNITDYDYTHKPVNNRVSLVNANENKNVNTLQNDDNVDNFLDEEWYFDHDKITKRELPMFIHKLYDNNEAGSMAGTATRILFNCNSNSSSKIISFNLNSLNPNETILDAELYFFWPLEETSKIYKESVVLRLYQFEKPGNGVVNESNLIENPDIHKLFNVIYISKAQRGWQTFKIKKPIDNWINGEDNLGLLLTISSYDSNKLLSIFHDLNQGIYSTFALISMQNNDTANKDSEIPDHSLYDSSTYCQRKQWNIDFKSLQWDKFIIIPDGFAAYDCSGTCNKSQIKQVNHLKMLHRFNKRSPCCIPSKYLPLPIMFYDKYDNVVLKNYQNIIVKECGCR